MGRDEIEESDEPAIDATLSDRLARGEELLADARATLADVGTTMNTAVNLIPPGALDIAPASDEVAGQRDPDASP